MGEVGPPEPDIAVVGDKDGGGVAADKSEEFVITFEDITVHVPESKGCMSCCSSKDNPFKNWGAEYFGMSVEGRAAFYTLDRVSGLVKSGEVSLPDFDSFDMNESLRRCLNLTKHYLLMPSQLLTLLFALTSVISCMLYV